MNSVVRDVLLQKFWIEQAGKKRFVTVLEMIFLRLRELAAGGNIKALRLLESHAYDVPLDDQSEIPMGILIAWEGVEPEEWCILHDPYCEQRSERGLAWYQGSIPPPVNDQSPDYERANSGI